MGFNLITNLASREESCGLPGALDGRDKSPIMDMQTQEDERKEVAGADMVLFYCCFITEASPGTL